VKYVEAGAEATASDGHLSAPSFHGMINTTPHLEMQHNDTCQCGYYD